MLESYAIVRDAMRAGRTDEDGAEVGESTRHDHVSVRSHQSFFPADAIGAPNARNGTGTLLTLHLEGLPGPIRTDITADKKIFRCRGPWRDFFKRHHLQPGDQILIERPIRIRVLRALRPLTRWQTEARSAA
jgi:hypothetical protein